MKTGEKNGNMAFKRSGESGDLISTYKNNAILLRKRA
jgi:hypothetical protein